MSQPAYKENEAIEIDIQAVPTDDHMEHMDGPEKAIYQCLDHGRQMAVSVQSIAQATNFNDVAIREIIRHLIMKHNVPIASVTSHPSGFYLIESPEEVGITTKSLRNRGIKILQRAAKLQKISLEQVFNQGKLELGLVKSDHDKAQRATQVGIAEEHPTISRSLSPDSDGASSNNVFPMGPSM